MVGRADRMNAVTQRMTDDLQQSPTATDMKPPFPVPTARIVAFENIAAERLG